MMTPTEALTLLTALMPTQREGEAHRILREFIEANTPWYPPQQEGYGPWIEYYDGDLGPSVFAEIKIIRQDLRNRKSLPDHEYENVACHFDWVNRRNPIVAYCVKQDKP